MSDEGKKRTAGRATGAGGYISRVGQLLEGPDAGSAPPRPTRTPPSPGEQKTSWWAWIILVGVVVALVLAKWTLLVAILGLAFLILVHEFGHFVFAKWFGMRVEKFYIGFPPAMYRRTRGETEYGVGMIPLGGFCKISGMTPEEDLPDEVRDRAYYNQPVWKRNLVIFAGPLFNILAAVLIFFVFLEAQGMVQPTLKLQEIVKGAPAASAGLQAGDTLLAGRLLNGSTPAAWQTWAKWTDATTFFKAHPNDRVELRYKDGNGTEHTVSLTLATNPQTPSEGYLGVMAAQVSHRPPPWTAAWLAVKDTGGVIASTFKGFWWLATGKVSATGSGGAAGPVGIIQVSADAVQQKWYPVLLALLSVNLGIINLIPVPPFDGGHILFNTLEAIRGRRVEPRLMERITAVGVVLVLLLFVFLTFNDIRRLFS